VTYGLGVLLLQAGGIILLPLYTRFLGPENYGYLQLFYRIGDVLTIGLMINGLRQATFNLWGTSVGSSDRQHIAASISWIVVLLVFSGISLTAVGVQASASFVSGVDGRVVFAGIVAILLQALTVTPLALMQARMDSTEYVLVTAGITLCHVGFTVAAVVVLELGLWGVVVSLGFTYTVWGLALTLRELRRSSFKPQRDQVSRAVRFSIPLVPTGLFFFILHSGDQIFLAKYAGATVLGVYALAYRLATSVTVFATQPLQQVWSAYMYKVFKRPDRALVFGKAYTRILAVYLFVGAVVVVFRAEIISIFATALFSDAAKVLPILILAHFFWVLSMVADSAFYVTRQTGLKPWIAAASTVVTLLAYAWLIPTHLALGAAVATLVGYLFHALTTVVVAQRVFRVKFEHFRLGVFMSLTILTVSIAEGIGGGSGRALLRVFVLLTLPVQAWILGVLTEEEKRWFRDRGRRLVRAGSRRDLS